jgi:putative addiction module CopG family antidote
MSEIQVELPEATVAFIEEQVQAGLFRSPSEMIAALIEDARTRVASKELCDFLDEGEKSEAVEFTEEDWQREVASLKARVLENRQR